MSRDKQHACHSSFHPQPCCCAERWPLDKRCWYSHTLLSATSGIASTSMLLLRRLIPHGSETGLCGLTLVWGLPNSPSATFFARPA